MKKKIMAKASTLAVALLMAASLVACGEEATRELIPDRPAILDETTGEYVKPEKITLTTDTALTEENCRDLFMEEYEKLTGIKLEIEQPAHNQYYEKVNLSFAGGKMPDAMEVGNTYYPNYANYGALFDMTKAWEESDLKNGRIKDANGDVVQVEEKYWDALKINGKLYGFPMTKGNGTITYIRGDWMNDWYKEKNGEAAVKAIEDEVSAEISQSIAEEIEKTAAFIEKEVKETLKDASEAEIKAEIEKRLASQKAIIEAEYENNRDWFVDSKIVEESGPKSYEEFLDMLRYFKSRGKDIVPLTAAGLVNSEAPYDIYLREFYQDAHPDFYKNEEGVYVDGMSEPQMIDALQRMQDAFKEGLIDREVITNKTSTCRNKFYDGKVGSFNYWAGLWCRTLNKDLRIKDSRGTAVPLPPIADDAKYIERPPTALAITTAAENPYGVFKWLCEYSHDGGEGQMLFTHGVERIHYKTEEDGTKTSLQAPGSLSLRDKDALVENYKNSTEQPATPPKTKINDQGKEVETELMQKVWYSPELTVTSFASPIRQDKKIDISLKMFDDNSTLNPVPKMSLNIADALVEITTIRKEVVSLVVKGDMTPAEGVKYYEESAGKYIEVMLSELNDK